MELSNKRVCMLENNCDTSIRQMCKNELSKEILYQALGSLKQYNDEYFLLIKDYIINYELTDKHTRNKIKNIIVFLQKYASCNNKKKAIEKLNQCFELMGVKHEDNIYNNLKMICRKRSIAEVKKNLIR